MGKMVECGTCDTLFEVNEDALTKKRKIYPGERTKNSTNSFVKISHTTTNNNVNFETASYNNLDSKYAQPRSFSKSLSIAAGVTLLLLFILLFSLGGREGGFLQDIDNSKRYILSGFIALIGTILILLGSRNKIKGLLTSIVLGGGLAAMPIIFPEVTNSINPSDLTLIPDSPPLIEENFDDNFTKRLETYKIGIGFDIIESLRKEAPAGKVKAIILLENKIQYLDSILPYLERVLNLEKTPASYSFGREIDGKPITLLTMSTEVKFDEVFELTKRFGKPMEMNDIHSALEVIEVTVDKEALAPPLAETTTNPLHPEYFNVNYLELKSIDRSRQLSAAERLRSGEYLGRQADISKLLASQITVTDHELSEQFISTLNNWTTPQYKTDGQVLDYAKKVAGTNDMSRSVMDYLVDRKVPGAADIFAKQWATTKGGLLWASYLIEAKNVGEDAVLKALPNIGDSHYKSAASILSKVGTARSIPSLNIAISKANAENKKYLKAVIDEIKSRQ